MKTERYYRHAETGVEYMRNRYNVVWLANSGCMLAVGNHWFGWQLRIGKIKRIEKP